VRFPSSALFSSPSSPYPPLPRLIHPFRRPIDVSPSRGKQQGVEMLYCGQDDPFYRKRKYERGGGTKRGEENGDFAYRYEMSRGSSKRSNEALNVITFK